MAPPSLTIEMNYFNNNFVPFLPSASAADISPTPTNTNTNTNTPKSNNNTNSFNNNIVVSNSNPNHSNPNHSFSFALSTNSTPTFTAAGNTTSPVYSMPNNSNLLFPYSSTVPLPIPISSPTPRMQVPISSSMPHPLEEIPMQDRIVQQQQHRLPISIAGAIILKMQTDARSKAENNYRTDPKIIEQNKVPGKKLPPSERKKRLRNKSAYISRHKERYYITFMQNRITRNEAQVAKYRTDNATYQAQIANLRSFLDNNNNNHNHNTSPSQKPRVSNTLTALQLRNMNMDNYGGLEEEEQTTLGGLPITTTTSALTISTFRTTPTPMAKYISASSSDIPFPEKQKYPLCVNINQDQVQRDARTLLEAQSVTVTNNNDRALGHDHVNDQNTPPRHFVSTTSPSTTLQMPQQLEYSRPIPTPQNDLFDPFSAFSAPQTTMPIPISIPFADRTSPTLESRIPIPIPNGQNQQLQEIEAALLVPQNSWDSSAS